MFVSQIVGVNNDDPAIETIYLSMWFRMVIAWCTQSEQFEITKFLAELIKPKFLLRAYVVATDTNVKL